MSKILIEYYSDNNLGDDLMVKDLASFLNIELGFQCILICNDDFTIAKHLKETFSRIVCHNLSLTELKRIDVKYYIRIGGSIFQHNTWLEGIMRYKKFLRYALMRIRGIDLIILNCNIGPFKSKSWLGSSKAIIRLSNLITCRDQYSFNYINKFKKKDVFFFPDMLFSDSRDFFLPSTKTDKKNILGISIYTAYQKDLRLRNEEYCHFIESIIMNYFQIESDPEVRLFVFDSGYRSDFPNTYKIFSKFINYNIKVFDNNLEPEIFLERFKECDLMIGTRFHSIILSLKYCIPVIPIIYAIKTDNLLTDLRYSGFRIYFEDLANYKDLDKIEQIFRNVIRVNNINSINRLATGHLKELKRYLISREEDCAK